MTRRRVTYSNVMSTLAVFLVIAGGTALAAALPKSSVKSGTVKDNSLKSKDLKDGKAVAGADVDPAQVQLRVGQSCPEGKAIRVINVDGGVICEVDDQGGGGGGAPSGPAGGDLTGSYPNPSIANGAVDSAKVADGSLTHDDLSDNSVDSSEIVDGGVDTAEVDDNRLLSVDIADNTLTGADVNESTLGQVPSALTATVGGTGRFGANNTNCDPESGTFVTCASLNVDLPAASRVLIIGRTNAKAETTADSGAGTCRVGTSLTGGITNSEHFLTVGDFPNSNDTTVFGVSPVLGPGTVSLGIDCNQSSLTGAIEYTGSGIAAVALSPN